MTLLFIEIEKQKLCHYKRMNGYNISCVIEPIISVV